jgi:hypothetical protein
MVQRSLVRQPELSLLILDSSFQPLPAARVFLYWWSNPYSRLQESQELLSDSKGLIQLSEVLKTEMVFPLMIHGIQEYQHTLCIEAENYRTLVVTLRVLPRDKIELNMPLTMGESTTVCGDFEKLYGDGLPRPDLTNQHPSVQAAYELNSSRE